MQLKIKNRLISTSRTLRGYAYLIDKIIESGETDTAMELVEKEQRLAEINKIMSRVFYRMASTESEMRRAAKNGETFSPEKIRELADAISKDMGDYGIPVPKDQVRVIVCCLKESDDLDCRNLGVSLQEELSYHED